MLPSLWEAVAGRRELAWAVRADDGTFVSFTPDMDRCWRWKDELPTERLACVGKHLGRWSVLVAPRLVPVLHALAAARRESLGPFEHEVAAALEREGPATAPQLRAFLGAEKKPVEKALVALQRAFVLTSAGLVEQRQGWGAVAFDLVARRFSCGEAADAEAEAEAVRAVLACAGEVSAADVAGALGQRTRPCRETLERLVEEGTATRRLEDGLALYRST